MAASKRYVAFLRGVSPMNAKMPELKAAFEQAGFADVKTVLSSGNVVFGAASAKEGALARKCEAAMQKHLGKSFFTLVRSVDALAQLLESDPYARFRLQPGAKRVVTFLDAAPSPSPKLPVEEDGARILALQGTEVFTAYVRSPQGPVFMKLLQKTFGKDITTRTWDTLTRCIK
jgi:uncharacterized protein (DUF1697 family)